ncbi:hypothetical protein [Campylobacter volucris]|nr:hypothetical protein [Campylobacter volucris]
MSETYEIYTPNGLTLDVEKILIKYFLKRMLNPQATIPKNISKRF